MYKNERNANKAENKKCYMNTKETTARSSWRTGDKGSLNMLMWHMMANGKERAPFPATCSPGRVCMVLHDLKGASLDF